MGVQLRFGTAGATGGGWSHQSGSLQPAYAEVLGVLGQEWQCRNPRTWRDRNQWRSLWSFGCRVGYGAPSGSDGAATIGADMTTEDTYEPYSCDGEGTQTLKWILGRVEDASGVAIDSATVRAYRASDNTFAGQDVSRADGSYVCPTPYASVNHYIVAYKAGSPDIAGTTVNTLVPTNIDGS